MMSRRLTLALVFLLVFFLSVIGVFAQDTDDAPAGTAELQSFFNNLGVNTEDESATLPEPRIDEPNWCTQTNRWGDERCNNSSTWVHRYNWWIGWVLAHCEIPGYFPPEDWPEECNWMLGASSVDDIFAGLYYVSPSNNSSVNGLGNTGNVGGGIVTTPIPTDTPTDVPTEEPTDVPTDTPTDVPTDTPTDVPTEEPTDTPTDVPTDTPTDVPTDTPTDVPTDVPTDTPTDVPTDTPTEEPTDTPTEEPTDTPTDVPTDTPNEAPVADFSYDCSDLTCTFSATGSSDSDGTIVSYSWSFGTTDMDTSYTFGAGGTYTVTLTVTDDDGAVGTMSTDITVTAPVIPNNPPTASFTHTCTNLGCNFDATGSSDSDGTIVSYAWIFGDNTSGSGINPSHTYGAANTYTVTLTVTDDDGATASMNVSLTVTQYTNLVANYTCSGNNIIVNIISGDAPFTISGGVNAPTIGSYNIGARNGNIRVTEVGGDTQQVSVGTNIC